MDMQVTHEALIKTIAKMPDFPIVRFESNLLIYEEALINGQYLMANMSAMGRPTSRRQIFELFSQDGYKMEDTNWRPERIRQHSFYINIDGQLLADHWQWVNSKEIKSDRSGCRDFVITLKNSIRPVTVYIYTRLDNSPSITRWVEIKNDGDQFAAISEVFPWSGLIWTVGDVYHKPVQVDAPFTLGRFRNTDWGMEGNFDWEKLPDGGLTIKNMSGASGWGCPFFILRNEVTQENLVGHFAWSGNWQIELYNDHEPGRKRDLNTNLYVRVGMAGPSPIKVLKPGEIIKTPAVHLLHLFGDLDTCVQNLHLHLRQSIVLKQPKDRCNLVEYNHIGYHINVKNSFPLQVTEQELIEEVEMAADAGFELFVVDAGWFGNNENGHWFNMVGDWEENPSLPQGLSPIFDRARMHGMLVGLWIEPERMGSESKAFKSHPEWQMKRRGEVIPQLDLANPEVAKYVERLIIQFIERYKLDLFRLDYNIKNIGEGGEEEVSISCGGSKQTFVESTMWRYYDCLYGIFERVHKQFPNLILENCSGGGRRNDIGMLKHFHFSMLSDVSSPMLILKILNGMTMALTPEQCMPFIGAISSGVADIDFMLRVALFSHFTVSGFFPNMSEINIAARERLLHTINIYKTFIRPMLSTCLVFHHTPVLPIAEQGNWCVLEYASSDRSQSCIGIFRLAGAKEDVYNLRPRGLDASKKYTITLDNSGQKWFSTGSEIQQFDMNIRVSGGFKSELVLFKAIK